MRHTPLLFLSSIATSCMAAPDYVSELDKLPRLYKLIPRLVIDYLFDPENGQEASGLNLPAVISHAAHNVGSAQEQFVGNGVVRFIILHS